MKSLTKNAAYAALVSTVFLLIFFTLIYVLIEGRFPDNAANLFPEHQEWFKIRSSVGQKIAYLVSATFAFFIGLSFYFKKWDRLNWPDPGNELNYLPFEAFLIRILVYRPHVIFFVLIGLATMVCGYVLRDYAIFSNLMTADTHAFYVDGELGQSIHSGRQIHEDLFNAYGLGPSLVYVLFRSFHGNPDYALMFALGRVSNWMVLSAFLVLAYRVGRCENAKYYGLLTLILTVIYLAVPMGIANTNLVAIHNLSGLRYLPLVYLLLVLALLADPTRNGPLARTLTVAGGSVFAVMFPDMGTFCLATLLLFLIAEHKLTPAVVLKILGYAALIFLSATLAVFIARQLFGFNIAEIFIGQASRFSQSNDGIKLEFDAAMLLFAFAALFGFFFYLYQAFRRPLKYPERVVLALTGCFILSLMYYMNRPADLYFWFYGLLIILPLQVLFTEFAKFPNTWMRISIGALTCILLVIFAEQYFHRFVERPLKRLPIGETTEILGVLVDKKDGDLFNQRMKELELVTADRKDNLVFTTTPWAAMGYDVSDRLPKEIVFKNLNQEALDNTLASILSSRPQYLVLEKNWPQGFASEVADLIMLRLAKGLQGEYEFFCTGEYWTLLEELNAQPDNGLPASADGTTACSTMKY